MAQSIVDFFKQQYEYGFASPTRYFVWTTAPGYDTVEWYPDSITLPSRSFQSYTDTIYGTHKQFPYKTQYNDEIVMTLPLSESGWERGYFENWMNWMVGYNGIANMKSMDMKAATLMISSGTHTDTQSGTFYIYGAYPSSIIPSNYGYGMQNEVAKLQVTFNYYRYYYE